MMSAYPSHRGVKVCRRHSGGTARGVHARIQPAATRATPSHAHHGNRARAGRGLERPDRLTPAINRHTAHNAGTDVNAKAVQENAAWATCSVRGGNARNSAT